MRDIADAAGLSAANLYHYFDGKNELLVYCQDRALERMLASIAAARKASRAAPDRLQSVLLAHVRTLLDDIEGATAHLQVESLPPAQRDAIVKKRDRYERAVRRIIVEGIDAGELVDMDPAIVARAILGAMNWTVTWFRREGAENADTVGAVMAHFLTRGIAARNSGGRS